MGSWWFGVQIWFLCGIYTRGCYLPCAFFLTSNVIVKFFTTAVTSSVARRNDLQESQICTPNPCRSTVISDATVLFPVRCQDRVLNVTIPPWFPLCSTKSTIPQHRNPSTRSKNGATLYYPDIARNVDRLTGYNQKCGQGAQSSIYPKVWTDYPHILKNVDNLISYKYES